MEASTVLRVRFFEEEALGEPNSLAANGSSLIIELAFQNLKAEHLKEGEAVGNLPEL